MGAYLNIRKGLERLQYKLCVCVLINVERRKFAHKSSKTNIFCDMCLTFVLARRQMHMHQDNNVHDIVLCFWI